MPQAPAPRNRPPPARFPRSRAATLALASALALAVLPEARGGEPGARPAKAGGHSATASATPKKAKKVPARPKRPRRSARTKAMTATAGLHQINEAAPKIVAFPNDNAAVTRAFADQRREQLDAAERIARAADKADRWRAVLFELRDLDSRADTEACFWRVLAYLRLGELRKARNIRRGCDISARDNGTLNSEDAGAASLQPVVAEAELRTVGGSDEDEPEKPGHAVENGAAYAGPSPARLK